MGLSSIKSIVWRDDHISILDQTRLPEQEVYLECRCLDDVADAIKRLAIRGAPAIGVAAALALAFECRSIEAADFEEFMAGLCAMSNRLLCTRPTAVNLQWALKRMLDKAQAEKASGVAALKLILQDEANRILREDVEINTSMGRCGSEIIPDSATVITICNTGSLATAGYGTALGVIRAAVEGGKDVFVVPCETRPLLQGARLTAWELQKDGIPFALITDGMAGHFMKTRGADLVLAGADRIAANGDVANKIGTYSLAVLAREHGIPFYIAAPRSTIDRGITQGGDIPIEERSAEEITSVMGRVIAPRGVNVWNPAFDITPAGFITGIITEKGILRKPYSESIGKVFERS